MPLPKRSWPRSCSHILLMYALMRTSQMTKQYGGQWPLEVHALIWCSVRMKKKVKTYVIYVDFHDAFYICTKKFMNRVSRQNEKFSMKYIPWSNLLRLINYKVGYPFFVDTHCTGGDLNAMWCYVKWVCNTIDAYNSLLIYFYLFWKSSNITPCTSVHLHKV